MAQRNSGYDRIPNDLYVTPQWVWSALYSVEPWARDAVDVCPINHTEDLLQSTEPLHDVATNPPFGIAEAIVRHCLFWSDWNGKIAMLLPHAWDTAKRRRDLFVANPFAAKYTITERIRWQNLPQKKAGPSNNHAWYIWKQGYEGEPVLRYLP